MCIMSGRRSSRKTRKNPPVSEQPQQPPQAEEEWQGTWKKGARQGTRGSVEVKKTSLLLSFFSAIYLFLVPLFLVPLSANLKMVIFGVK